MSRHRTHERSTWRSVIRLIVVLAIAAGVAFLAVRGFDRVESSEQAAAPAPAAPAQDGFLAPEAKLLVISDSIGGGVDPAIQTYPDVLAEKLGWGVSVDAVGSRGFLPTDLAEIGVDETVAPFIDTLKFDVDTYQADYIIVDGGRNDLAKDPEMFAGAFDQYLTLLRTGYPRAKIIALVPAYVNPQPAEVYPVVSEAMRLSAEKNGVYVIDPIAEGWYRDIDLAPLLWTDGVHLNAQGGEYYAQRIIDNMRELGVVPTTESEQGAG